MTPLVIFAFCIEAVSKFFDCTLTLKPLDLRLGIHLNFEEASEAFPANWELVINIPTLQLEVGWLKSIDWDEFMKTIDS